MAVFRDEGISGAKGRAKRPGLDALLKGVARREFDIVAAWSVCRLGRSLSDLIGLLGELRSRDIDLYLHQQALDTSTPSGRALFGMLGVFSEFERAMIRDRVMAGLDRARSSGKRLGRPRTTPFTVQRIRAALDEGRGVRETARLLKVAPAKVSEIRRMSAGDAVRYAVAGGANIKDLLAGELQRESVGKTAESQSAGPRLVKRHDHRSASAILLCAGGSAPAPRAIGITGS